MYDLSPQPAKKSGCFGKIVKGILIIAGLFVLLVVIVGLTSTGTPTSASTPAMSIYEMKMKASTIPFKELARNTEQYVGSIVKYDGRIVQVMEGYGSYTLRVNITKDGSFWTDTVLVTCSCPKRPLEDDIISLVGTVTGRQSYKTVLGATLTLPEINADFVEIMP